MNEKISKSKKILYALLGAIVAVIIMIIVTRAIDFLYILGERRALVHTFFEPSDILGFVGIIFSVSATITLALIAWQQNKKLNDMNTQLQKQNMKISQNALVHSSYNFFSYRLLTIEGHSTGRIESPLTREPIITLNYIKTDDSGSSGSSCELEITFFAEAFSNTPICMIELHELDMSFEHSYGRKIWLEEFCMDSQHIGQTLQTRKCRDNTIFFDDGNDYEFTMRLHIPFYYDCQSLASLNFDNLKIKMIASYINLLSVKTKLSHELHLSKDETDNYFKTKENISFLCVGL